MNHATTHFTKNPILINANEKQRRQENYADSTNIPSVTTKKEGGEVEEIELYHPISSLER